MFAVDLIERLRIHEKERTMATRHSYTGAAQGFNGTREQQAEQEGMMGRVKAAGEAVQSQAEHVVSDYPISTVLAVFGIGLGVGVVLGSSLFSSSSNWTSSSSSWYPSGSSSSWLPSGSSSSWFPSMSSSSSSWLPSSNQSWFGNGHSSNWGDGLMKSAKNMCGY